jgi:cyclophilin family peptidyl-prolyl cis-trans isomerase
MKTNGETAIELFSFLVPTETERVIRLMARSIYHFGSTARILSTGAWMDRITI